MNSMGADRLDRALVEQGYAQTRSQAQRLIRQGRVALGGQVMVKAGQMVALDAALEVEVLQYVSRGGEKLTAYLDAYAVDPKGLTVLDVGASTGGFSDVVLQRGALHVTCLDVGHGQLHASVAEDARVVSLEGINARDLAGVALPHARYALVVVDVSFISLRLILQPVWARVEEGGCLICLIKPQFELGKAVLDGCKGVVMSPTQRREAIATIEAFVADKLPRSESIGLLESPVAGGDGNVETLGGWRKLCT